MRILEFIAIEVHQLINIAAGNSKFVDHRERAAFSLSVLFKAGESRPSRFVDCKGSLNDMGNQIDWPLTTNSMPDVNFGVVWKCRDGNRNRAQRCSNRMEPTVPSIKFIMR